MTARRDVGSDDVASASSRPSTHDPPSPWWTLVAVECGNFAVYMDGFPNNTAVLTGVPPEELGVANGFFTTARNFGQAIGASLAAEILAQGLGPPEAFRTLVASIGTKAADVFFGPYLIGQSNAFEVAATLGFLGAIISAQRGPDARPDGR